VKIYCTGCKKEVEARLTNGAERYPHRPDLYELPFWKCDTCGNYVGCHHKTDNPTKPLGVIATKEILEARKKIHALLDPLWKSKRIKRGQAYAYVGHRLGYPYHNGEIRTVEEARKIYQIVGQLHNEMLSSPNQSTSIIKSEEAEDE
jgi:hypothetical protein